MPSHDANRMTAPNAAEPSTAVGEDVLEPYLSLEEPRLVLDLRPTSAFHQAHLAHSYHISPVTELKSRYSYLPARTIRFLVLAHNDQYAEVTQAFVSTPSARLVFLSCPKTDDSERQDRKDGIQPIDSKNFFSSARRLGLVRTSHSLRDRTKASQPSGSETNGDDVPELLFRPSNAVRRTVLKLEGSIHAPKTSRVLDLGCGAGRDLGWILHGSRTRNSAISWSGVGVDSWKAALHRAQQLMEDLFLNVAQTEDAPAASCAAPICEKLLWANCSSEGFLEPLTGTGKGKSVQSAATEPSLWNDHVKLGLQPLLLPTADASTAIQYMSSEAPKFNLILCIRFYPRALLRRLSSLICAGGVVLISHFVVLSPTERATTSEAHPDATIDYDSPPHEGRIQPGEIDALVDNWNASVETGARWTVDSEVLEPIEDGRIVKSVALRKQHL